MANYSVYFTAIFDEKLKKSEKSFQDWVEKILDQLAENPFVGKPLGVNWLREKKYGKFRVYHLIYQDIKSVYVVNLSDKKNQREIINSIKLLLEVYKTELEELQKDKSSGLF